MTIKMSLAFILFLTLEAITVNAQQSLVPASVNQELIELIDSYASARESQDTVLLKSILTIDIDQLVSSGEWRHGLSTAVQGMKRSSQINEGKRTLEVERVRLLNPTSAILDAKYIIEPQDGGAVRNMWSTFVAVYVEGRWKITAIRNMLPTGQ
jgi:uncharacterized protein (TIGR02246 family)